ncbi:unnamed protein product [Hymenolepis diminuta]|uniref:Myb-like domain-containing protein n=1 Tax=Hymenolepis diminuta TaxID=6216 RepID=A0A0R3SJQ3_HYMDI|nr:unnamed protein product [Hymenolepis diminuta]
MEIMVHTNSANIRQVQATPDQQQRQEASIIGNILELPDARNEEEGGEQHQSSNDFSSSNSVQIGGRFRLCRNCRIAHIPTTIAPDLLLKCEAQSEGSKSYRTRVTQSSTLLFNDSPNPSNTSRLRNRKCHRASRRHLSSNRRRKSKTCLYPCAVCKSNVNYGTWSMSQYLPGRDIDSFCPRTLSSTTLDTELDVQMNQNASVCWRPSSRNLTGAFEVGLNNEHLEKNINRSPLLSDVAVKEEGHPASMENQLPNHSPVFEEEQLIQGNFSYSLLQISTRMTPLEVPDNSLLFQECEKIDLPAGPIHSNEIVKLREEDDNNSFVISPRKSSILEETDETLLMMCEQDQSLQHGADTYVCADNVSGGNELPVQSNIEENHYISDLDNPTASETAEHYSPLQFPQRSPILEDDEATSPLRCEQEHSSQGSYATQICAEDSPNEYDSRVQSNVEGYYSPSKLYGSGLIGLSYLRRPLSPEVVSLAGPRKQTEEKERRKTRLPRRASLVAREAIGLSMKALFTPTKLTSDRVFEKSHSQIDTFSDFTQSMVSASRQRSPEVAENSFEHSEEILRSRRPGRWAFQVARDSINPTLMGNNTPSQVHSDQAFINDSELGRRSASYGEWSVDSSSNNGSCKLILRRVNRTLQTDVESASSYSSPRARSLPHILRSTQTKSNVSTPLVSLPMTAFIQY